MNLQICMLHLLVRLSQPFPQHNTLTCLHIGQYIASSSHTHIAVAIKPPGAQGARHPGLACTPSPARIGRSCPGSCLENRTEQLHWKPRLPGLMACHKKNLHSFDWKLWVEFSCCAYEASPLKAHSATIHVLQDNSLKRAAWE